MTDKTTEPTPEQVTALAEAMEQLLDDMHASGGNTCGFARAKARVAYEPWVDPESRKYYMSLEEAEAIVMDVERG